MSSSSSKNEEETLIKEGTARRKCCITKEGVVGSPVSEVSLLRVPNVGGTSLQSPSVCLYTQGPFLHLACLCDNTKNEKLLVFAKGGNIHGISHSTRNDYTIVFGGRQISFIGLNFVDFFANGENEDDDRKAASNKASDDNNDDAMIMKVLPIKVFPTASLLSSRRNCANYASSAANNAIRIIGTEVLTMSDWIWDCRSIPGGGFVKHNAESGDEHEDRLLVGLAHNSVEEWRVITTTPLAVSIGATASTNATLRRQQQRQPTISACPVRTFRGNTRCISYSLNLAPSQFGEQQQVAVGTANEILLWSITADDSVDENHSAIGRSHKNNDSNFNESNQERESNGRKNHSLVGAATSQREVEAEHRLQGHLGVIHAVRFNPKGNLLASASDDRSVRLWERITKNDTLVTEEKGSRQEQKQLKQHSWRLKWTGWGHTARCWDVAFRGDSSGDGLIGGAAMIVSVGEDGTARVWDGLSGSCLAVLRGHACQCSLWSISVFHNTVVTGADNGSVAIYNLLDKVVTEKRSDEPMASLSSLSSSGQDEGQNHQQRRNDAVSNAWTDSFLLPDDRKLTKVEVPKQDTRASAKDSLLERGDTTDETLNEVPLTVSPKKKKQKKKTKKKISQQIVVGMKFYLAHTTATAILDRVPRILISTRSGSLFRLDICSGEWRTLQPWLSKNGTPSSSPVKNLSADCDVQASDGCCMDLHPSTTTVAIGTTRGDIVLSPLDDDSSGGVICGRRRRVLSAREHRSVQRLVWIKENALLAFHVRDLLWWSFSTLVPSVNTACHSEKTKEADVDVGVGVSVLNMGTKAVAISHAFNEENELLVVGDTRGNLALFDLNSFRVNEDNRRHLIPTSVLYRVHQKEHVTAIVWINNNKVLSVGNDGCLHECVVDVEQKLLSTLISVPLPSFTGISHVWKAHPGCSANCQTIVGGYYGNRFAVVDVSNGYEFFRADTGGRQRTNAFYVEMDSKMEFCFSGTCGFAVCANRKDGRNEIMVHFRGLPTRSTKHTLQLPKKCKNTLGVALHGETIFDACLFDVGGKEGSLALLTGSEDCSSRVSLWRGGILVSSKLLPAQESGVRAVCHCRSISGGSTLAAVSGAKLNTQFFLVHDLKERPAPSASGCDTDDFSVELLGHGSPSKSASIDHRINAVKAFPLHVVDGGNDAYLVATGDSNGSCYLYRVLHNPPKKKKTIVGLLLCREARPILSLDMVSAGDPRQILLVIGTNEGDVSVRDISSFVDSSGLDLCEEITNSATLACYRAHSMATNAISAQVLQGQHSSNKIVLRLCSGGDDQAVCCCDLEILTGDSSGRLRSIQSPRVETRREAALSAIRGINWIDGNRFVTTGYDQRLTLWQWENDGSINKHEDIFVDVGDINCLACSTNRQDGKYEIAIGGVGIEFFSVNVKNESQVQCIGDI